MEVTYKNYRKKVAKEVKIRREAAGLSREALSDRIEGVCSKTIERIEKASYSRDIGLHTLQKVCVELKISLKMVLGGSV